MSQNKAVIWERFTLVANSEPSTDQLVRGCETLLLEKRIFAAGTESGLIEEMESKLLTAGEISGQIWSLTCSVLIMQRVFTSAAAIIPSCVY